MSIQETIRFMSDGLQLTGTLHCPETQTNAAVIGCHGLLANRHSPKQIALAEALNHIGIAYLRFDHRGCGDSQGRIVPASLLADRCRDLYHAVEIMKTRLAPDIPVGMFGSSFGGTVVIATAAVHPVPAVVTYAAPVHSQAIRKPSSQQIQAYHDLTQQDTDAFNFDISRHAAAMRNILVVHCQGDEIVPSDHARQIHAASGEPKQLIIFDNGDHRMSDAGDQRHFVAACVAWYRQLFEKKRQGFRRDGL